MSRLFYARKKLQMLLADVYGDGQDSAINAERLPDSR
jgi:hypothetical protein